MQRLEEAARLNNQGAALLQSGEGNPAMKLLREALVIVEGIANQVGAGEISITRDYHCTILNIPCLDEHFYTFDNALVFEASPHLDLEFTGAMVLFNMALALHQKGMATGQELKLRQALIIYNLCLRQVHDTTGNSGCLLAAALNNSAQILYNIGDYEGAIPVLQVLAHELHRLPENVVADGPFKAGHLEQFLLNFTTTKLPSVAPAA